MAQLALFNEGVRDHFPICGNFRWNFCEGFPLEFLVLLYFGIFVRYFLWQGGGFIWFPLHMTMVWDLANGAGIPAPSDAIDVCNQR